MADRPRDDTWWLAADGKWYPPTLHPDPEAEARLAARAADRAEPRDAGSTAVPVRLTRAVTVALGTVSAVFAAAAVAGVRYGSVLASPTATPDESAAAESVFLGWSAFAVLAMTVAGVLLLVWTFRVSRAFDNRGATGRTWRGGWTIGAWFVPIASIVLPRFVFSELERIAQVPYTGGPIGERWRKEQRFTAGDLWWLLWVAGLFLLELMQVLTTDPTAGDAGIPVLTTLLGIAHAIVAAAGVALIVVISRIAARAAVEPVDGYRQ